MKDRRKLRGDVVSWSRFFWCTLVVVISCVIFTGFTFSSFRLFFGEKFHPEIVTTWRNPAMEVISDEVTVNSVISIRETVILPDQVLIFLKYPLSSRLLTNEDLDCVYFAPNSSKPHIKLPPNHIDGQDLDGQIVRCPLSPRGHTVSLEMKSGGSMQSGPLHKWDTLVYEAMIDRDNTTIVFVKGLNLRPDKLYNASRFECVYGWDFSTPKFLLRSNVLSIAQEIVRCKTPLSILSTPLRFNNSIKVSIRIKGRGTFHSIARPGHQSKPEYEPSPIGLKSHEMCVCTMLRNQARFLKEWVMYHAKIGVERWFVYDNNSEDDIENVVESLVNANYNITRHVWPWIKTQEAGFAHCALRARSECEWVGFIDVDEFFHLPTGQTLNDYLRNQTKANDKVAEVRVSCHNFGPSGLKIASPQGVMVGYTCRMLVPERHKSIVKPEALNSTLINVVHHFHLRPEFRYVNADRGILVINHYKYQVWDVFKQKFYRRVATYVADWQDEQNVGSKDRAPGLGTRAVEPPDWSTRFCEVSDTGLKDWALRNFLDPITNLLPWQEHETGKRLRKILASEKEMRKQEGFL